MKSVAAFAIDARRVVFAIADELLNVDARRAYALV